jgi:cysteine desulfuration protein SufE
LVLADENGAAWRYIGSMPPSFVSERVQALADDFDLFDDWDERMSHVIDLGRKAAPLSAEERIEPNKVRGCASQVWIFAEASPDRPGGLRFRGQSDSAIVQGLATIVTGLYADLTPEEILETDAGALLDRLGLTSALTAQRANGLAQMVKRIRVIAAAAAPAD